MQSNNNINNSGIHNEPPPSYHEVIANKQKEIFAYKNIKSFNECDKHDNDAAAILSPTSNTSSTYEFNQSENNHHCRNLNDNNTVAATGVVTSPLCDLDSDSVVCECTTAINHHHHHFIANFCENCNKLYSNNNNVTLTTCGQQNCFQNQFNYCMDMDDQYNNNNIIDQDCCMQQSQTSGQIQEHTSEPNSNNKNDENGNETNSINLNCNGLIRLDMSQIMDHTGLPTYDAAIKLESSGYV